MPLSWENDVVRILGAPPLFSTDAFRKIHISTALANANDDEAIFFEDEDEWLNFNAEDENLNNAMS